MTPPGISRSARPPRPDLAVAQRNKLRRLYVVAAAILAALVPLVLFAGFWIRSELVKSQRDVESYLSARAVSLSRRIDAEIEHQLVALRALSALPSLDEAGSGFVEAAERVRGVMPHWSAFGLVDPTARRSIAATRPDWPDAKVIALTGDVATTRKPRIETHARLGLTGRDVILLVPVVRDDRTSAVLVTAVDSRDLQEITVEQSRETKLLSTLSDGANRILSRSLAPDTSVGQEISGTLQTALRERGEGLYEATSREGEPMVSAFVRSPLTGWVSVVSMDRAQIDQTSTRSIWATVAALALSLILAAILAVFVVHTVTERRVSDERLAASRALGELDARLLATTQEALGEQRKASSEREVLLREIYHRVKNNLQIVQSLLRLGSRDLSPDQREPFESAVRRIGAMARVHTLLYNSPDLASIDFKDYLGELLRELSEGFGAEERSIASDLSADSMPVPLDTAVPLAFIAVEILTNAYRHAFPSGRSGKISVEIKQDEQFGLLVIEDDGVGFAPDPGPRRRLGLTIVRKLVQQIGGALDEPKPGESRFVVRFPLGTEGSGERKAEPALT